MPSKLISLLFPVLLLISVSVRSQSWTEIGGTTSGVTSTTADYPSLQSDNDGNLYLAYRDASVGGRTSVKKYTRNTNSWSYLGSQGFSPLGGAIDESLCIAPDGTPYLAYRLGSSPFEMHVVRFDGSAWGELGPGLPEGATTRLAIDDNNIPYLAFKERSAGSPALDKLSVMMFNGSAWVYAGNAGFAGGTITEGSISLAFDHNNVLYASFLIRNSTTPSIHNVHVMKLNAGSWVGVGSTGAMVSQTGSGYIVSIAFDNNNSPFISYNEGSGYIGVMKFDGSSWLNLGNNGVLASDHCLRMDVAGNPLLAYDIQGNSGIAVKRHNGTSWVQVGAAVSSTSYNASPLSMIVHDDIPYLAYQANPSSPAVGGRLFVRGLDCIPATVSASGPTTFCPGGSVTLTANSGSSYLWSNGAITQAITVDQSGNYNVSVTGSSGCVNTSGQTTVTVKPIPGVLLQKPTATSICDGSSVQLNLDPTINTSGFQHQWTLNSGAIPGATSISYEASQAGTYALTVSDGLGCSKTSMSRNISVKPNPVAQANASGATSFCSGGSVSLQAAPGAGYSYKWFRDGLTAGGTPVIKAKLSGNYVLVARLNGCADTSAPVSVTAYSLPASSISSFDPSTMCSGNSALLQATPSGAGYHFEWKLGQTLLPGDVDGYSATQPGVYKITVTDSNGCQKTSAGYKLSVTNTPTASITPLGSTSISSGGNVKLRAANGTGVNWQWYIDGNLISGATMRDHIATAPGDYTVTISRSGCSATSSPVSVSQTGSRQPGITSFSTAQGFDLLVYPNPAKDHVFVSTNGKSLGSGTVMILDLTGKTMVMRQLKDEDEVWLDVSSLSPGIYLLRYANGSHNRTVRILKD